MAISIESDISSDPLKFEVGRGKYTPAIGVSQYYPPPPHTKSFNYFNLFESSDVPVASRLKNSKVIRYPQGLNCSNLRLINRFQLLISPTGMGMGN